MTPEEKSELEALRAFKRAHDTKPLDVAFDRLNGLINMPYSRGWDGIMSVSAFRAIADCLILLRDEIK